ncbi:MAG: hypothetical protein U0361_23030 [Nitrospiraceae bacterium]
MAAPIVMRSASSMRQIFDHRSVGDKSSARCRGLDLDLRVRLFAIGFDQQEVGVRARLDLLAGAAVPPGHPGLAGPASVRRAGFAHDADRQQAFASSIFPVQQVGVREPILQDRGLDRLARSWPMTSANSMANLSSSMQASKGITAWVTSRAVASSGRSASWSADASRFPSGQGAKKPALTFS